MISIINLFESKFPLRYRVEVIVVKGDQILLSVVPPYPPVVTKQYYGLPGGGIEDGDTLEKTAEKECLEELGIRIKNIRRINIKPLIQTHQQVFKKKTGSERLDQRGLQYSGYHTIFCVADYDKVDKSLYGKDNDQMKYQFFPFDDAIKIMKDQSIHFKDKKRLILFKKRFEVLKKLK